MWLVGVVVRRYIDIRKIIINFPYSTCIYILGLFLAAASLLLCSFLNVFSVLFPLFFYYIANVTHRTFEIVKKNRDPVNIKIIELYPYLRTSNVRRRRARASPETSTCEGRNQVRMTFD